MITSQIIINAIYTLAPATIIVLTGSRALPYIQHPRDYDYSVICDNKTDYTRIENYLFKSGLERPRGVHWMLYTFEDLPLTKIWSYGFYFNDLHLDKFYQPEYLRQILQSCQRYHTVVRYELDKSCYHFYTTCCLILNGNYLLTPTEIARINRFHDFQHTNEDIQELDRLWNIVEKQYNVLPVNKPQLINKASVC